MKTVSEHRRRKIEEVVSKRQRGLVIVLEDIHDPHNCAAIMRTADAVGIKDIWFVFDREKPYNPREVGKTSSSSANKWMDFRQFPSTADCVGTLKTEGYTVVATALDPAAEPLTGADLTDERIAVIFGNEHAGVSHQAVQLADRILYIPMDGFVQSLNVSVSAAIVMAEIVRQRRESGSSYTLDAGELEQLTQDYLSR